MPKAPLLPVGGFTHSLCCLGSSFGRLGRARRPYRLHEDEIRSVEGRSLCHSPWQLGLFVSRPVSWAHIRVMRAPIRFSTAPHDAKWYGTILQPLIYVNNVALAASVYPGWRTARVRWDPNEARLRRLLRDRPSSVIFYTWHAYILLIVCAFKGFPADLKPTGIGHDGFRSRAVQQTITWFGCPVWAYRRTSPVRPKQQLADYLAGSRRIVGLFPDAGGPEGEMRPGIVEVARETNSLLVPMVVAARPMATVRAPQRLCLPLPFSSVSAYWDEPIAGDEATVNRCRTALERLEARAVSSRGTDQ